MKKVSLILAVFASVFSVACSEKVSYDYSSPKNFKKSLDLQREKEGFSEEKVENFLELIDNKHKEEIEEYKLSLLEEDMANKSLVDLLEINED